MAAETLPTRSRELAKVLRQLAHKRKTYADGTRDAMSLVCIDGAGRAAGEVRYGFAAQRDRDEETGLPTNETFTLSHAVVELVETFPSVVRAQIDIPKLQPGDELAEEHRTSYMFDSGGKVIELDVSRVFTIDDEEHASLPVVDGIVLGDVAEIIEMEQIPLVSKLSDIEVYRYGIRNYTQPLPVYSGSYDPLLALEHEIASQTDEVHEAILAMTGIYHEIIQSHQ